MPAIRKRGPWTDTPVDAQHAFIQMNDMTEWLCCLMSNDGLMFVNPDDERDTVHVEVIYSENRDQYRMVVA